MGVYLWLERDEGQISSKWSDVPGEIHFHDYRFNDYSTEILSIETEQYQLEDIRALNWEETHREWTGEEWVIDFAALDQAAEHFVERGYTVTIQASDLQIYLSDFESRFLNDHLPSNSPPDDGMSTGENQADLTDYEDR